MYSWGWARSSKYIYRVKEIFIFSIFLESMYSWGWARSSKYIYRVKKMFIFLIFLLVKHHQLQPNRIFHLSNVFVIKSLIFLLSSINAFSPIKVVYFWKYPTILHLIYILHYKFWSCVQLDILVFPVFHEDLKCHRMFNWALEIIFF